MILQCQEKQIYASLPCAAGKTALILALLEYLLVNDPERCAVVVMPSMSLQRTFTQQLCERTSWSSEKKNIQVLTVEELEEVSKSQPSSS
jgi:superfamily II DNA or RNA helicase